ncbi:NlpC/P60 family protein [Streptomyces shenzhenensis]|uniref:C40 family peptidase n=1 Tax=Streptomyces shenzhenensis TaxID=943815 RepID=UPI00340E688F
MAPESRDEVRQRIDSLYDQAENATGNFNATRAMTARTRTRGVPLRKRPGERGDPALDEVARQWFDVARAKLGPTVPAVLPADRMPQRPAGPRPGSPVRDGGREAASRPVPELPAGPAGRAVAELTGGSPPALPAGSVPALPGGPAARDTGRSLPEPAGRSLPELPAGPAAAPPTVPGQRREPGPPRALPAPAAGPRRPSPAESKENNRRRLAVAREVLTRYAVPQSAPAVASAPRPEADLPLGSPGTDSLVGTGTFAAGTGTFAAGTLTGTGSVAPAGTGGRAAQAVAFARAQIGRPCVWGATGPGSYDYASLTQAAWKAAGVSLPRSAQEQAHAGTPVALTGIQDGDLVFFFDNDSHVGLYVGNGMMVHAPGPGSAIREESIFGAGESAIHRVIRPA